MKEKLRKGLFLILALVFVISSAVLLRQFGDNAGGEASYADALAIASGTQLQKEREAPGPETGEPAEESTEPVKLEALWVPAPVADDPLMEEMAAIDLAALREVNGEVLGWIRIPETKIDYPLMQGQDNDYYLNHTWDRQSNSVGSIFLEHRNSSDLTDYNTIVYGHNMKDGAMFAGLHRYASQQYWQVLGIPQQVIELADLTSGMVLVTGTAGSGKTTTQACIIDRINRTRDCHIVTLEDPIEYLHRHQKSIVSQREITIDTRDYLSALRSCVRQAPDVILLGEMRDAETMHTAMSAAETGHMVIATLHTKGAVNAIDRIIDAFPSTQQTQIRIQLATVLRTVVSQQLLPDVHGGMVPACEVMQMNSAIRSMIRDNKNHQIDNAIASGGKDGMISMDQSILSLYHEGKISKKTALLYADKQEQLKRQL